MLALAVVLCSILYVVDGQPQPSRLPELPSVTCPGGRCPPQTGLFCFYNGKIYLNGQVVSKDGCNTCTCTNGKLACTERACLCPNGNSPLPNVKCDDLSICPDGYICDTSNNPLATPNQIGICCKGELFCVDKGKKYLNGEEFSKDGCNKCTCINGNLACTERACLCPNGNSPLPDAKCDDLSICPEGYFCDTSNNPLATPNQIGICCKDEAPKCKPGFIEHPSAVCGGIAGLLCPTGYDCVQKGIAGGLGSCCKVNCKAVPCPRIVGCAPENIVTPPGQCCPICREPKCKDGTKPLPGVKCEGFPGNIHGTIIRCPAGYVCDRSNNDPNLPDLPGICCKPAFCLDGKRKIPDGESFMDDCNTCQCNDGQIICTLIACPPKCRPGYIPHPTDKCGGIAGMLCPEGYECDMSHVPKGTADAFGNCCKIDCKAVPCPRIVGCAPENIITLPGQCCPICREPKCKDGNKPLPGLKCEGFPGIMKGAPAIVRCPAGYVCDKSNNDPKLPDLPGICCKDCSAVSCVLPVGCLKKDLYTPPGECCPRCKVGFCEVDGKRIENGVSLPVDCNTCQCVDGQLICTLLVCDPKCKNGNKPLPGIRCEGVPGISRCPAGSFCEKSSDSSNFPELPGICCKPTCMDGKITRKDGEVFFKDCNTCRCSDGKILCTKKACPDCRAVLCVEPTCPKVFTPPGQCCPSCLDCSNVHVLCALPVGCSKDDFYTPPGECCPQCKGTCEVNGKRIANGEIFPVDCNTCQCVDGEIFCTLIQCVDPPPKCKAGFIAHPKAKCGGFAGLVCPKGYICDTSNVPDGTADAFGICCKVDCRLVRCGRPVDCPEKDIYTPIGQCCPVCLPQKCKNGGKRLSGVKCGGPTGLKCRSRYVCDTSLILKGSADFGICCKGRPCIEKGRKIKHGRSFKRDCNTCRCNDGQAACTKIACPGKPGQTCLYKGKIYTEGQTTGDYCYTCTCTNGVMQCPDKNLCAKRSCTYHDQEYKHGETFGDYCHTCTCTDGKVDCPKKSQCATNKPCSHKGHTYKHNETFLDICNTCRCSDGKVSCTKKLCCPPKCPQLRCANQVTLKGACCPTCVPGSY